MFKKLALISVGFLCASVTVAEEYTIGAILPLTGSEASLGSYVKNGIELALEQMPAEQRNKVKVLFEDDQLSSTQTVNAYKKLGSVNKLSAVIVLGSGAGNALGPIADRDKIPLVAVGASDGNIVKNKKFVFIHWVTPEAEAKVLAPELKERGYKRLGFVTHMQEGALAITEAVLNEMEALGIRDRVVLDERVLRTNADYKSVVTKLKNQKVDGIMLMLLPEALVTLAKEIRSAGITVDLFGAETFEDEASIKSANGALDGQWYVNIAPATDSFENLYKAKYGTNSSWGSSNAFDTVTLLTNALIAAGGDPVKTVAQLDAIKDYKGAAGTYSAGADHRFALPAVVKIVTKEGFKQLRK